MWNQKKVCVILVIYIYTVCVQLQSQECTSRKATWKDGEAIYTVSSKNVCLYFLNNVVKNQEEPACVCVC